MILLIDNYDSFTWNLADLIRRNSEEVRVIRNDELDLASAKALEPTALVISPGPGRPAESGICREMILDCQGRIPVLGICLGHQLIGEIYGAKTVHAGEPVHGKTSEVRHKNEGLFQGVGSPFLAMRYHSLVLDPMSIPDSFEVTAWTEQGVIMGIRHKELSIEGLQFHPESILTESGNLLINNWIRRLY